MRIIILFSFFILGCSSVFQSQDLVVDFEMTDITGETHSIYQYLNQGKSVILDFSTTWCSPCWAYHETHQLENLYTQYGPDGTDEVMVFFVECDPSTNQDDLEGNTSNTQGDWIQGVSYPIVDDQLIQELFSVVGYPTIVTICPDRTYSISGTYTSEEHYQYIQTNCNQALHEKDVSILRYLTDTIVNCTDQYSAGIEVINLSSDDSDITSFEVNLSINGEELPVFLWEGELPAYHTQEIFLPPFDITESEIDLEIDIVYLEDLFVDNNSIQKHLHHNTAISTGSSISLAINTGDQPSQTSWKFINYNTNEEIASGSPFMVNQLNVVTLDLSSELDCVGFFIEDERGNGNQGDEYYQITDLQSGEIIVDNNVEFGRIDSKSFQITAITNNINTNYQEEDILIHPVPADKQVILFKNNSSNTEIEIYTIYGELVLTKQLDKQTNTINTSSFKNGVYFIHFKHNREVKIKRILITH